MRGEDRLGRHTARGRIPRGAVLHDAGGRGHIDVLTSVKGFKCSIVEDDVTYKNTSLKRFTAVFSLKGMCILFR